MTKTAKQHLKSNYLELSLVFCLALILIPQTYYLIILTILGCIAYVFEICVSIFLIFKIQPLDKAISLIKNSMSVNQKIAEFTIAAIVIAFFATIVTLYLYALTNFMFILTAMFIGLAILGSLSLLLIETKIIATYLPEDTNIRTIKQLKKLMKERTFIALTIFLTIIYIILTKTNPMLLLLSISFYFLSYTLKQIDQLSSGPLNEKLMCELGNSTELYIFNFTLIMSFIIVSYFSISPLTIMAIYIACPKILNININSINMLYIKLDINISILGKILMFLSLFIPPALIPTIITLSCFCILIDTILLNFNIDLSLQNYLNKKGRQPESIYLSLSALIISLNPWLTMPTLLSQSSIFCLSSTLNSSIQNLHKAITSDQDENIMHPSTQVYMPLKDY